MRKKFLRSEPPDMFLKTSLKRVTNNDDEDTMPIKMAGILHPHENDVLMGRGGKNNQHCGNEKLRAIARERCEDYQIASKKGKSRISKELVTLVREMKPSGRFLRKVNETSRWEDVGDDIAREKTSQVLRDAVAYQQFGPSAKSHRHKAIVDGETKGRGVEGEGALGRPLRPPRMVEETISNDRCPGDNVFEETEERDGERRHARYSPMKAANFSPVWPNRKHELRGSNHRFSPAESSGTFAHDHSFPPPYLGIMRDPGSSSSSSSVFPVPQPFELPSVTPASTASSAPSKATARKRLRYYESPMSCYYGSSKTGSFSFSSPQPYHSQPPLISSTPPTTTSNTSPMVTSTPPFVQNTPQHHYGNFATPATRNDHNMVYSKHDSAPYGSSRNTPAATDMLCSPHDTSHFRSPKPFPTTYYPGARFATANSPGTLNFHKGPHHPPILTTSSRNRNDDFWTASITASPGGAAGGENYVPRFDSRGGGERFAPSVDTDTRMTSSIGEFDFPEVSEDMLPESDRDGAISPYPLSALKLESDTS